MTACTLPQYIIHATQQQPKIMYDVCVMHSRKLYDKTTLMDPTHSVGYFTEMSQFTDQFTVYDNAKNKIAIHPTLPNMRMHYIPLIHSMLRRQHDVDHLTDLVMGMNQLMSGGLYGRRDKHTQFARVKHAIATECVVGKEYTQLLINNVNPLDKPLLKKLLHAYTHVNIKNTLVNHVLKQIENSNAIIQELCDALLANCTRYYDLNVPSRSTCDDAESRKHAALCVEIQKMISYLVTQHYFLDAYPTCLYFLRRFLDKDYIEHCIMHAQVIPTACIINALTSLFKFKITHTSIPTDINQFNEIANDQKKIVMCMYLVCPMRYQIECVTVDMFPKDML
jgi:hypothetical protein